MTAHPDVPEVTVAMPAHDRARFIRRAIESVLSQEGVRLELVVVDDASEDDTASVVRGIGDPRIRLLHNAERRGIGYCHNRILRESRAPILVHVDSDDLILPGALATIVQALRTTPGAGMAHARLFRLDEQGRITRLGIRRWREYFAAVRAQDDAGDLRRRMLVHGMLVNALRTYRRSALEAVGGFDERLAYGVDYETALRLMDRFDVVRVEELLYGTRQHGHRTTQLRLKTLRFWWSRSRTALRLRREGRAHFLRERGTDPRWLVWVGLWHAILGRPMRALRAVAAVLRADAIAPAGRSLYGLLEKGLGWWPLDAPLRGRRSAPPSSLDGPVVGYFAWKHPGPTFVQRELAALARAGLRLEVFAERPGGPEALGTHLGIGPRDAHCLRPGDPEQLARDRRAFFRESPLRYGHLRLFVATRRYGAWKSRREDRQLFDDAVALAARARERGVDHLHAPWADRCALVALLAARLAGVPFSVQARAHELYRDTAAWALREKLRGADFVVTNARYNRRAIRSRLPRRQHAKVHVVYEGVEAADFDGPRAPGPPDRPFHVLCVARLIEEKGLVHLLRAARLMADAGQTFRVEVIGGSEEPAYTRYYVELMRLHEQLGLRDRVVFRGALPFERVREAYTRADLFALPCVRASHGGRDVTPNALIEAMAARLPVVASRSGGIPEIVEDGVEGVLVAPGDAPALADALARLMADPALRTSLGEAARKKAEARFDLCANAQRLASLFRARWQSGPAS